MAIRFPERRAGRGATVNDRPQRFGLPAREADGDWLDARAALDGDPPPLRTTVTIEKPRTILSREQLENRIYGWGEEVTSNAIDVLIHGMSRKLGADAIRNVRGLGWRVMSA